MIDAALPLSRAPTALAPTIVPSAAAAAPAVCVNCGGSLLGEFCHGCGQRSRDGRLTVRGIFSHLATDAFDLNRGLLFTAIALFRRPGEAVREYLAGATIRYTNPVKYLLLTVALAALVFLQADLVRTQAATFVEPPVTGSPEAQRMVAQAQAEFTAWLSEHLNVLMVVGVPFTAWFNRRLFRSAGFGYAEFLVFTMFTYAQTCLIAAALVPLAVVAGLGTAGIVAAAAANFAYSVWAVTTFTRSRPLSGALRGLGAQVLSLAVTMLLFGVAGVAFGVAYALYRQG